MRRRGKDIFAPLRGLGVGASPDEFGAAITREQVAALQGELPSGGKADHMEPSAERSASKESKDLSKEAKDPSKESKDLSKESEDLWSSVYCG